MAAIIPRWEWRTFGSRFGLAETRFGELQQTGVQDSEELYFLGGNGANAKVRDDLMDIKLLRKVDADGLECWEPVMKAPFPLPAAEVAKAFELIGIPVPTMARDAYTLRTFIDELAVPAGLVPVHVRKRRVRYVVGGCTSEVSELWANDKYTRTIAIEGEDAAAVVAAVKSVGFAGFHNISYIKGLRLVLDDAPERYAVVDAGTNSIKLHIGERVGTDGWRAISDRAELTRLGEGLVEGGAITPAATARTVEAIAAMADEARHHNVRAIVGVGTAGMRMASNGAEVVEAVRERSGVAIEIISGEEEGRLAYVAVEAGLGMPAGSLVVFDTGGGSSQLTFGRDHHVDERFSVNVGAVRYTERFGLAAPVTQADLHRAFAAIAADLSRIDGRDSPDLLVGMGGAVTNIAAVSHHMTKYDPDVIQGTVLERSEIERQIEMYRTRDAEGRRSIPGLQPNRAGVILAGACIVRTIMDKLGKDSLTVSDRGLRHGIVAERFGGGMSRVETAEQPAESLAVH